MRLLALIILLPALSGCYSGVTVHGVPNFAVVDSTNRIYRGGQPTLEGWHYLKALGVTNVVKLNEVSEGSDADAGRLGMVVQEFPISFGQQITGDGLDRIIPAAVAAIVPGTYGHCEKGQNRTGTAFGYYRVNHDHWSKAAALYEMNSLGWGDSLPGLKEWWDEKVK